MRQLALVVLISEKTAVPDLGRHDPVEIGAPPEKCTALKYTDANVQVNLFKVSLLFSIMKVPPKEISLTAVLAVSFRPPATLSVSSAELTSCRV